MTDHTDTRPDCTACFYAKLNNVLVPSQGLHCRRFPPMPIVGQTAQGQFVATGTIFPPVQRGMYCHEFKPKLAASDPITVTNMEAVGDMMAKIIRPGGANGGGE